MDSFPHKSSAAFADALVIPPKPGILDPHISQAAQKRHLAGVKITIEISDRGIATTDFDISLEGEKYNLLYESGREAVLNFFSA